MQKRDDRLGICGRVFNFISSFIFPGLKRITLDRAVSIDDQERPEDAIQIHHKKSEEDLKNWTPINNKLGSLNLGDHDQSQSQKGDIFAEKKTRKVTERTQKTELPRVQVNGTSQARDFHKEEIVSKESAIPKVRHRPHLLSVAVAPNIDEKLGAFLQSRKEAMSRNHDSEPEASS